MAEEEHGIGTGNEVVLPSTTIDLSVVHTFVDGGWVVDDEQGTVMVWTVDLPLVVTVLTVVQPEVDGGLAVEGGCVVEEHGTVTAVVLPLVVWTLVQGLLEVGGVVVF